MLCSLVLKITGLSSERYPDMTDIELALEHEVTSFKVCMCVHSVYDVLNCFGI